MDIPVIWWIILGESVVIVALVYTCVLLSNKVSKEITRNRSQSTRYGQITEQFLPLMQSYPWDPKQFRFLGTPVDGVQFEPDRVLFIEFKAAGSKLSKRQREIRDMVHQGKVGFEEIRAG
jgi:predicted Holliday junction resolvase-like endonuclease